MISEDDKGWLTEQLKYLNPCAMGPLTAEIMELACYGDAALAWFPVEAAPIKILMRWIDGERIVYPLDGRSNPIHYTNGHEGIEINESTVLDYLRFFCFAIDGGPDFSFALSENQTFVAGCRLIETGTATITGVTEGNGFLISASVFHRCHVFNCRFLVERSGMVEMLHHEEGIPVTTVPMTGH